jgi:predicted NBD/HSP70 family sugar kinase
MHSLGIDLGGSGFRMGVFDLQTGELVGELHTVQFTQSPHPSTVLPQICERLDDLGTTSLKPPRTSERHGKR